MEHEEPKGLQEDFEAWGDCSKRAWQFQSLEGLSISLRESLSVCVSGNLKKTQWGTVSVCEGRCAFSGA